MKCRRWPRPELWPSPAKSLAASEEGRGSGSGRKEGERQRPREEKNRSGRRGTRGESESGAPRILREGPGCGKPQRPS